MCRAARQNGDIQSVAVVWLSCGSCCCAACLSGFDLTIHTTVAAPGICHCDITLYGSMLSPLAKLYKPGVMLFPCFVTRVTDGCRTCLQPLLLVLVVSQLIFRVNSMVNDQGTSATLGTQRTTCGWPTVSSAPIVVVAPGVLFGHALDWHRRAQGGAQDAQPLDNRRLLRPLLFRCI